MSDATQAAILVPLVLLLAGFILNEIGKPLVQGLIRRIGGKPDDDAKPGPVVGDAVAMPEPNAWQLAYDGAIRERDDEREDFAHYMQAHRACHAALTEHGIPIPADHYRPPQEAP